MILLNIWFNTQHTVVWVFIIPFILHCENRICFWNHSLSFSHSLTIIFPFNLRRYTWHLIIMQISGNMLTLLVKVKIKKISFLNRGRRFLVSFCLKLNKLLPSFYGWWIPSITKLRYCRLLLSSFFIFPRNFIIVLYLWCRRDIWWLQQKGTNFPRMEYEF